MTEIAKPQTTHVEERLRQDLMIWLGSVRPDGRPHIVPVWFLWDGSTILLFSYPNNQKIRNLRHNQQVTLAIDNTKEGEDVIIIDGYAELLEKPTSEVIPQAYYDKYNTVMQQIGLLAEPMVADYSQPIRITPTKFR